LRHNFFELLMDDIYIQFSYNVQLAFRQEFLKEHNVFFVENRPLLFYLSRLIVKNA